MMLFPHDQRLKINELAVMSSLIEFELIQFEMFCAIFTEVF
jgi:hypothetical protein